jgi:cyclophilin family peptidyl-prolyl cis-trans isomerase
MSVTVSMFLRGGVLIACALAGPAARAEPPSSDAPAGAALRAELSTSKRLFAPNEPLHLRLTLFNPTAQTIEMDAAFGPGDNAIALPDCLVYGTAAAPALRVALGAERAAPVPAPAAPEAVAGAMRLAPGAAVGAEIDLRERFVPARYTGAFLVEWSPPGATPATLRFRVESRKVAVMVTDYGKMMFDLRYEQAPLNVDNFLDLARQRFYDGTVFHRLIPNFILQGGSPTGSSDGQRPDGALLPAELDATPFDLGVLAMAHRPDDPDSASCQFFVGLARLPDLDGAYTVIGKARDEQTLRTLRRIAELQTDADGRPLRPLVLRFLTLVDADAAPKSP